MSKKKPAAKKPAPRTRSRKPQKLTQVDAMALRFGDGRFLRFAAQVFAIFQEFNAITEPINTTEGIKARAAVAVKFIAAFAAITDSPNDDQLATALQALVSNERLLELLAMLLGAFGNDEPQKLLAALEQDERFQALKAENINLRNIDLNQLISLILKLLEIFGSKPPVAPATGAGSASPPFGFPSNG